MPFSPLMPCEPSLSFHVFEFQIVRHLRSNSPAHNYRPNRSQIIRLWIVRSQGTIWIYAHPDGRAKDGLRCTAIIIVFGLIKGLRGLGWLSKGRVSKRQWRCEML
ncbi:hypothetical protein CDAR_266291 [Caerostris darwini]|uniref:Uncharacterized protein n=1 Tax=Caerostris darwini TaxID=1538125 RepID=A0AAV4MQL9_9ARAC|nr:hypothetical protein CDAR_266291 [Caerostris darwini]